MGDAARPIALGIRHGCPLMRMNMVALGMEWDADLEQGFVDQFGVWLTREEAYAMAVRAGQVEGNMRGRLFSEDLY